LKPCTELKIYNNKQHKALCLMVPNQMEKSFAGLHHFFQLVSTKQKGQNDKNNGGKMPLLVQNGNSEEELITKEMKLKFD